MKTLNAFILAIVLFAAQCAMAGEVKLVPAIPTAPGKLHITYASGSNMKNFVPRNAKIFCYDNSSNTPAAFDVPLSNDGNLWNAEFEVPPGTVFGLISVSLSRDERIITDNNRTNFWEFRVGDENKKPLEYACLRDALTRLGVSQPGVERRVDFRAALSSLQEELKYYPANIQARIGLSSLQFDMKKISNSNFKDTVSKIVETARSIQDENTVRAVVRALRSINETERADELEKNFAEKYPRSETAEDFALARLAEAESLKQFTVLAKAFFENFPASESREKVFSAVVTASIQNNKYKALIKYLKSVSGIPPSIYNRIALALPDNTELLPDSKLSTRISEALTMNTLALDSLPAFAARRPKNIPPSDWNREMNNYKASFLASRALIEAKGGLFNESLADYTTALGMLKSNAGPDVSHGAMLVCKELGRDSLLLEIGRNVILASKADKNCIELYSAILNKHSGSPLGTSFQPADTLGRMAFDKDVELLYAKKLDMEQGETAFKTLDGRVVELNDYAGKIVVLNYFASWCEPCQTMFPVLNKLSEHPSFKNDIVFLGTDVWEKDDVNISDLKEFLEESEVSFNVVIDETGITPQKFGITGLPATLMFDRAGKLQYILSGFTDDETYTAEITKRIEALKKY